MNEVERCSKCGDRVLDVRTAHGLVRLNLEPIERYQIDPRDVASSRLPLARTISVRELHDDVCLGALLEERPRIVVPLDFEPV